MKERGTDMAKLNVCVLFGGMSPEHAVSLRSAESVLNNMDRDKYNIFPVMKFIEEYMIPLKESIDTKEFITLGDFIISQVF